MGQEKLLNEQTQKTKLMLAELKQNLQSYDPQNYKTLSHDSTSPGGLSPVNKKIAIGNQTIS